MRGQWVNEYDQSFPLHFHSSDCSSADFVFAFSMLVCNCRAHYALDNLENQLSANDKWHKPNGCTLSLDIVMTSWPNQMDESRSRLLCVSYLLNFSSLNRKKLQDFEWIILTRSIIIENSHQISFESGLRMRITAVWCIRKNKAKRSHTKHFLFCSKKAFSSHANAGRLEEICQISQFIVPYIRTRIIEQSHFSHHLWFPGSLMLTLCVCQI